MTQANGSVTMAVQVPMLGLVSGTETMEEVISGTAGTKADDGPAVVTRPMDTRKVAAPPVSSGADAGGNAAIAAEGSTGSPVTVTPAGPPAGGSTPKAADPEAKAKKLLQVAQSYLGSGMKALGVKKLNTIVEKYPDTAAARKAKALLAKL